MPASRTPLLAAACLAVAVVAGVAARLDRPAPAVDAPLRPAARDAPARAAAPAPARDAASRLAAPAATAARDAASRLPAPALDNAGYLALADRLAVRLGALWDPRLQRYDPGPGAVTSQLNADLLLVHAAAARAGHRGPARRDARARAAARYLTGPAIWRRGRMRPGWRASADVADMHPVFQAEVAEGLAAAYRARGALGLDETTARRIRRQLAAVAGSRSWRWPALLLNQFNWFATIYAADATVNDTHRTLAASLGRQLARFTADARNLGPGLRFRYLPSWSAPRVNFDSAEYANIVLGFARSYGQARAAGMPRPARLAFLRDWVRRALSGYWTHAGYLNWDTGLGYERWHQRKKVGLAHGALIGIAGERELQPSPQWGRWAKWMLDRGLRAYVALTERQGRFPAALAYGVDVIGEPRRMDYLTAARYAANAVRAFEAGLGRQAASEPPALYAFDPDTGRLAITTPAYNTAIVATNDGAHPYGGLDLARLYDARQEVAANIGGTRDNAFGLRVRSPAGRTLLRTQYGARGSGTSPLESQRAPRGTRGRGSERLELQRAPYGASGRGSAPLELQRAPHGVGASLRARRVYAGPFSDLRVRGRVAARGLEAVSAYRFTPAAIEGRWSVMGRGGRATVTFPSWGRRARVVAVLRDGRRIAVSRRPLSLARVRALHVRSARSGYVVVPRGGRSVRLIATRPEGSQPRPGPTLEVALGEAPVSFGARISVRMPS